MNHFAYRDGVLHAEDASIERIAESVGTPFYCYSEATLRRHVKVFSRAFDGMDTLIAYSVKASSNIAVVAVMASEGAGADVVSAGELKRARAAGVPGSRIVFSGVGKTRAELAFALDEDIYQFNVESEPELDVLNDVAASKGRRAPIAFRVNPDVKAGGHEKISTGKAEDKFGVAWSRAKALYRRAAALPGIDVKGVDVHIGSQITALAPFQEAFEKVAGLVRELRSEGIAIERVDLGGGLGVPYQSDETPPPPADYARMVRCIFGGLGVQIILEPGRLIVANAGVLVCRVIYDKPGEARRFLIVDAGMNDLIRPALYDAYHEAVPVREPRAGAPLITYDIVGPVCESSDLFGRDRPLPEMHAGSLIAFKTAGAYGAVQASQYNTRPLAPEVLVSGSRIAVIRRRPTVEEILAGEEKPDWL